MSNLHRFIMAGFIFAMSACSTESVKRTTYETLQNIEQAQCEKDLSADCSERDSYETYKRTTQDLETGEGLSAASLHAAEQARFITRLKLPTGQTAVVAEGELEARSTGSFSVRLYEAAPEPDATTFFTSGLIRPRDGTLEKVILADVDGDRRPEIIVIARSAGTGGYLSAHAFRFAHDQLYFHAAVDGLAPDADPVTALRNAREGDK